MNLGIRTLVLAGVMASSIGAVPRGPATPGPAGEPPSANFNGVKIETDITNANSESGDFTMPKHVKFTRPGTDAVGDRARGNFKTGLVTLTGHVVLHDNGESPEAQRAGAASGGGPATLTCDELQVDTRAKVYVAIGNVHYRQGQRSATADNGKLDQGQHTLDLTGDVHMGDGDETLTAQTVHYNTLTKDLSTSGQPVKFTLPSSAGLPGTGSTLPTPAAKATPKPK